MFTWSPLLTFHYLLPDSINCHLQMLVLGNTQSHLLDHTAHSAKIMDSELLAITRQSQAAENVPLEKYKHIYDTET